MNKGLLLVILCVVGLGISYLSYKYGPISLNSHQCNDGNCNTVAPPPGWTPSPVAPLQVPEQQQVPQQQQIPQQPFRQQQQFNQQQRMVMPPRS